MVLTRSPKKIAAASYRCPCGESSFCRHGIYNVFYGIGYRLRQQLLPNMCDSPSSPEVYTLQRAIGGCNRLRRLLEHRHSSEQQERSINFWEKFEPLSRGIIGSLHHIFVYRTRSSVQVLLELGGVSFAEAVQADALSRRACC